MASLKKRVARLEQRHGKGPVLVFVFEGETQQEAWEKYLRQHPEAREEDGIMWIIAPIPRPPEYG